MVAFCLRVRAAWISLLQALFHHYRLELIYYHLSQYNLENLKNKHSYKDHFFHYIHIKSMIPYFYSYPLWEQNHLYINNFLTNLMQNILLLLLLNFYFHILIHMWLLTLDTIDFLI